MPAAADPSLCCASKWLAFPCSSACCHSRAAALFSGLVHMFCGTRLGFSVSKSLRERLLLSVREDGPSRQTAAQLARPAGSTLHTPEHMQQGVQQDRKRLPSLCAPTDRGPAVRAG